MKVQVLLVLLVSVALILETGQTRAHYETGKSESNGADDSSRSGSEDDSANSMNQDTECTSSPCGAGQETM